MKERFIKKLKINKDVVEVGYFARQMGGITYPSSMEKCSGFDSRQAMPNYPASSFTPYLFIDLVKDAVEWNYFAIENRFHSAIVLS